MSQTTWAVAIEVSPLFIHASYKHTNTIGPFPGPLGANLDLVGKLNDQSTNRKWWLVSEAVIDTFKSHLPREDSAIRGETSEGYSDVVPDLEDLLFPFVSLLWEILDMQEPYQCRQSNISSPLDETEPHAHFVFWLMLWNYHHYCK